MNGDEFTAPREPDSENLIDYVASQNAVTMWECMKAYRAMGFRRREAFALTLAIQQGGVNQSLRP